MTKLRMFPLAMPSVYMRFVPGRYLEWDGVHVPMPGLAEPRASLYGYANVNTGDLSGAILDTDQSMLVLCFVIAEKVSLSMKFYIFLAQQSGTYIFR